MCFKIRTSVINTLLKLFLKFKVKTSAIYLPFLNSILIFFTGLYAYIDQVKFPLYLKSAA